MKRRILSPACLYAAVLLVNPVLADTLELPPEDLVRSAVLSRPDVRASAHALEADKAEAERLASGPHEFNVRVAAQQRRATDPAAPDGRGASRFMETQLALERGVRWPGKADQDASLGQTLVSRAALRRADAIHETSRLLLRNWMNWLHEKAVLQLWQEQVQAQVELTRHAERRVKAGDAARTELNVQEAMLAQAQASLLAAQARAAVAQAVLDVGFAGLTGGGHVYELKRVDSKDPAIASASDLVNKLEERSHERRLAQLEAQWAQAQATRIDMEQRPDPTLGVFAASERAGAERLVGVSFSLTLSGSARSAASRAARASAAQADQQAEYVRQKVRSEAASAWVNLDAAVKTWESQDQARTQYQQVLAKVSKGWQLGEFSQSDLLMTRSQFIQAALAEIDARVEARHAQLRLQLDLHETWEFDDE